MNDDSILGNTLGELGGVIKQTGKQVVKMPGEMVENIGKQMTGQTEPNQNQKQQEQQKSDFATEEERKEFLKGLYGESNSAVLDQTKKDQKTVLLEEGNAKKVVDEEFEKQIADKSPEEKKKLRDLRQQLHNQYYQQLVNPPKEQEERPQEKIEKEKEEKKQMEALEFEEKKKKELPPSVKQGTHEKVLGISG